MKRYINYGITKLYLQIAAVDHGKTVHCYINSSYALIDFNKPESTIENIILSKRSGRNIVMITQMK